MDSNKSSPTKHFKPKTTSKKKKKKKTNAQLTIKYNTVWKRNYNALEQQTQFCTKKEALQKSV